MILPKKRVKISFPLLRWAIGRSFCTLFNDYHVPFFGTLCRFENLTFDQAYLTYVAIDYESKQELLSSQKHRACIVYVLMMAWVWVIKIIFIYT